MTVEALGSRAACMVRAGEAGELSREDVIQLVTAHGAVVFEGLGLDVARFEAFTDRIGISERSRHPSLHGKSRDVLSGRQPQALHREFFAVPCVAPDLVWFYCQQPSAAGGLTTFADGIEFLDALSSASRELFAAKKLRFQIVLTAAIWRQLFPSGAEQLETFVGAYPELTHRLSPNGDLHFTCISPACTRTKFGGALAFCNPVMHALQYPHYYRLALEDGEPIPADVKADLESVAARVTATIPWQAGTFALIDNSRVMHGRQAFDDPQRRILARHAMALW